MSVSLEADHDNLVKIVAERYRRDGYQVDEEPLDSALPFQLSGYRPDLIAQKEDRHVMVEVKSVPERTSFERLRSVVDEVKQHRGWEFVLITPKDLLTDDVAANDGQLSWDEVDLRIQRAERLSEQSEYEAAYMLMWIAFEQALRFQARQISLPLERLAPAIVIRQLYSQGELSMSQFDSALDCQSVRNRIVHGFPVSDLQQPVKRLASLVREVVGQWRNPTYQ